MAESTPTSGCDEHRWLLLRRKIESARACLVHQGSLTQKRRGKWTCWHLRFFEATSAGRQQRSIYVGDGEMASRVAALLAEIRAPAQYFQETLALAKLARRVLGPVLDRRAHRRNRPHGGKDLPDGR